MLLSDGISVNDALASRTARFHNRTRTTCRTRLILILRDQSGFDSQEVLTATKPLAMNDFVTTISMLLAGARLVTGQPIGHYPGQVTFQNAETPRSAGATSHLVTNIDRTLLVGTQYKAELYYQDTDTGSLTPIAASLSSFKSSTTSRPGTWGGPVPLIDLPAGYGGIDVIDPNGNPEEAGDGTGTGPDYYPVTLAVRVWDSTTGDSFETATVRGTSPDFVYTQRYLPAVTDTYMLAQRSFQLVPEPSAIVLGVLSGGGLLLFCRRQRAAGVRGSSSRNH